MKRAAIMREDVVKSVESVLYDFPDLCRDIVQREKFNEAGGGPSDIGPIQGGEYIPTAQRIIEKNGEDTQLNILYSVVEQLINSLKSSPEEIQEIIDRLFFRRESVDHVATEMGYTMRTLYRKRYGALRSMRDCCLDVYKIVKNWQYERDEDRIEAILKVNNKNDECV